MTPHANRRNHLSPLESLEMAARHHQRAIAALEKAVFDGIERDVKLSLLSKLRADLRVVEEALARRLAATATATAVAER